MLVACAPITCSRTPSIQNEDTSAFRTLTDGLLNAWNELIFCFQKMSEIEGVHCAITIWLSDKTYLSIYISHHLPKHCEYSSLLTGHIPVSRAWRCCSLVSSCSCWLITSRRVAGVLDTHCTQSFPPSLHSRGGRMELRISSVCWFFWASTGGSFPFGGEGMGPPLPIAATVGCWPARGVRA